MVAKARQRGSPDHGLSVRPCRLPDCRWRFRRLRAGVPGDVTPADIPVLMIAEKTAATIRAGG
jgi:hypothetical protein